MKTKGFLKIGMSILLIVVLGLVSFTTFAHKRSENQPKFSPQQSKEMVVNEKEDTIYRNNLDENVSITIDSNTSEKDFEDIKQMLSEHQISATFTNITRDGSGKLTGIKIMLEDANGNQTVSQISSNLPISQIVFGRKDGSLYITQGNRDQGAFAFFNRPNMLPFGSENDSLQDPFSSFGGFNFNDFFNDESGSFFLNGQSMTLEQLKEEMQKQMAATQNGMNGSGFFSPEDNSASPQKFRFIDDPNSNKAIIIDGKDSDFKTLDSLAKADKLEAVDVLKPETAMSVYGQKAKDGAIIATTKTEHH